LIKKQNNNRVPSAPLNVGRKKGIDVDEFANEKIIRVTMWTGKINKQ